MDLNFRLATGNPAARISRDAEGRGVLLYTLPFAQFTPPRFIGVAEALAHEVTRWQGGEVAELAIQMGDIDEAS